MHPFLMRRQHTSTCIISFYLLIKMLLTYMYTCFCLPMCLCTTRMGAGVLWNWRDRWLLAALWVVRIQPGSSGRTANEPSLQPIVPLFKSTFTYAVFSHLFVCLGVVPQRTCGGQKTWCFSLSITWIPKIELRSSRLMARDFTGSFIL